MNKLIILAIALISFDIAAFTIVECDFYQSEKVESHPIDKGVFLEDINKTIYVKTFSPPYYSIYSCDGKNDFNIHHIDKEDCLHIPSLKEFASYDDKIKNKTIELNNEKIIIKSKGHFLSLKPKCE